MLRRYQNYKNPAGDIDTLIALGPMWLHIRIGRHEVLIPINLKNCNFREKNSQVMKEREIYIKKTDKGGVKILRAPRLLLVNW